ncbi:MAG: alpha/beta hydrolase [Crocinitomicaceae bacterium]|jgi:predicted alpha/beta superfamily hydrolase|nr:alpha/beta hydrolase [Crocinitomicaceae bacterium]
MKIYVLSLLLILSNAAKAQEKPFVLGEITELNSEILGEKRVLNIYLPEGYRQNDSLSYPVIYLLDGSADEDFIHVSGLVQFANFSWVNLLPQSIVVGIANVDRKRDYTFPTTIAEDKTKTPTSGGSEKFLAFLGKELIPFVEKNYRTNSDKMLIGQSLGGLVATEILFKKPEMFNQYVIISPSLWWDKESLLHVEPAFKGKSNSGTSVFVAVGKEGDMMVKPAKALHKLLKKNGFSTEFSYFGDKNHATIMHQALYEAFEFMGKQ